MAFADLEADLRSITRKPATFAAWLETADREEARVVLAYLSDAEIPTAPLMRKLRSHGIPITAETVRAHRVDR